MKLRVFAIAAALLGISLATGAQPKHVDWAASCEKVSRGVYDIVVTATIERGWHIYDTQRSEMGPAPTELVYSIEGEAGWAAGMEVSPAPTRVYDDVYMCEIGYFEDKVVFRRRLNTARRPKASVKIEVCWMECNDENCMPPATETLSVTVK